MVRFVLALLVWIFVGLLVAAEADAQVPPDYSLAVGYVVLFVAWVVSYWVRARSRTTRRWWWIGGVPELLLVLLGRRRRRDRPDSTDARPS